LEIKLAAFLDDGRKIADACGKAAFVNILSVFRYLVDVESDNEKALDFIIWKYGSIFPATFSRSDLSYNSSLSVEGMTYWQRLTGIPQRMEIGPSAMGNENRCASALGHEIKHFIYNSWQDPGHSSQNGQFAWEFENLNNTGHEYLDVQGAYSKDVHGNHTTQPPSTWTVNRYTDTD